MPKGTDVKTPRMINQALRISVQLLADIIFWFGLVLPFIRLFR